MRLAEIERALRRRGYTGRAAKIIVSRGKRWAWIAPYSITAFLWVARWTA